MVRMRAAQWDREEVATPRTSGLDVVWIDRAFSAHTTILVSNEI
jgi:hypothetical protein